MSSSSFTGTRGYRWCIAPGLSDGTGDGGRVSLCRSPDFRCQRAGRRGYSRPHQAAGPSSSSTPYSCGAIEGSALDVIGFQHRLFEPNMKPNNLPSGQPNRPKVPDIERLVIKPRPFPERPLISRKRLTQDPTAPPYTRIAHHLAGGLLYLGDLDLGHLKRLRCLVSKAQWCNAKFLQVSAAMVRWGDPTTERS